MPAHSGPASVPAPLAALLGSPGAYSTIARAARPPLSASYVSRVLSGASRPSLDVASRMAGAIGISLDTFRQYLAHVQARWDAGERPGRVVRQRENPRAKLDRGRARAIRQRIKEAEEDGETLTLGQIALEEGVSRQAISDIARGVSYPD